MKKAVVVISFGTAVKKARKSIENIENLIKNGMRGYDFYRAFTSQVVIDKIKKTEGEEIFNTEGVFEYLKQQKYDEVLCQSTHVLNGLEYSKMCGFIEKFKNDFENIYIGKPLLTDENNYKSCVLILDRFMPKLKSDEAFVFMGHGSIHFSNSAYSQLENMFRSFGRENVYVGTVEGFPSVDYILKRLELKKISKVYIMPFMIVAGEHVLNDLAGASADSWKSVLNKNGFETEVIFKSLGDFEEIGNLFLNSAKSAVKI